METVRCEEANENFSMVYVDSYREYPWRLVGLTNALVRPFASFIPKPAYQLSLGVMHTFFLTNAYDYAVRIDSKSKLSSAFDCYTWHCGASWVGPALVIDNVMKQVRRYTNRPSLPNIAAYCALAVMSPLMDKVMDWYFYGFWSAGNKEKPRLTL
jgi:hypothetical protein